MNRKVTYLRVHDLSALFDGIGNITGNSLPLQRRPGVMANPVEIDMVEGPHGVEVHVKQGAGVEKLQIIPYANIQKYDVEHPDHKKPEGSTPVPVAKPTKGFIPIAQQAKPAKVNA